jgi:drug/metabolite transporter (DMT)-like permease
VATRSRIALALATVYLVWGSTYLAIRWVVTELPPFAAGAVRFVVAGGAFLLVGLLLGPRPTLRELRNSALIGMFLPGLSNGLVGLAERRVPSSITALVLAVMPLWVALLETVRPGGSRPPLRAAIGLLVGFCGTALLVLGGAGAGGHAVEPLGIALLLTASLVWASGSLAGRGLARPTSWMVSAGTEMLAGGLFQGLIALVQGELPRLVQAQPSARALGALIYLAVIGGWLGYGAFSWLMRNARPALVATYAYVNPLVAVVLGAVLAGETLTPRAAVSGAIIVAAVVLVTTARR